MTKEILINVEPQEKRVAVVNQGRLEEFYIERPQDKTIVGNIYKGIIEAVVPSIGAAFVDIGLPKKGFLYLSEIESAFESLDSSQFPAKSAKEVKKGQEILVQVVKEQFGNKGPRLSCHIGLPGRYLVIMPQDQQVGVSRRIEDDEERRRLKQVLLELKLPKNIGFIVRTAACGKAKKELLRDAHFLIKLWRRLERIDKRQKAPSIIYEEYDLTLRVIRDSFTDEVNKLIIDSKPEFYRVMRFIKTFLGYLAPRLELYQNEGLFEAKDMEKQVNRIFSSNVYLKSKAYIIIEPTEGLVVIDVNSGGFKDKVNQEEAAFRVNCEAAVEAAHQLRLRDLGGIIVIDFIDMEKESHRRQVLNTLKNALSTDRAKYDILGISKFGLVEMTRERIHNTVHTQSYQSCPYCQGRGKIRSALTIAINVLKELKKYLKNKNIKEVNVVLNPVVVDEILKNRNDLKVIEYKYRTKINLISNPTTHIEDIKIS
jgi:ribonuclease G